jgi:hypothetical protein
MNGPDCLNPLQLPRLPEIATGKKFWGYLDTEALQSRYVLAAHFVRGVRDIVEVGGYRHNAISRFLTGQHESVTVYSLDAEFEALELDMLNGAPCRVRHLRDYFQNHAAPDDGLGLIALGLEIQGDLAPFCDLLRRASIAVIEVASQHPPSLDCLARIQELVPCRLRCRVDLDLSANEPLMRDELALTNLNPPFWMRSLRVLEPESAR